MINLYFIITNKLFIEYFFFKEWNIVNKNIFICKNEV